MRQSHFPPEDFCLWNVCHAQQLWFSVHSDVVLYKYWPIIRIMWLFGGRLRTPQTVSIAIKMVFSTRTHTHKRKFTHSLRQTGKIVCNQKEQINVSIYRHFHISHTTSHHYPYMRVHGELARERVRERVCVWAEDEERQPTRIYDHTHSFQVTKSLN